MPVLLTVGISDTENHPEVVSPYPGSSVRSCTIRGTLNLHGVEVARALSSAIRMLLTQPFVVLLLCALRHEIPQDLSSSGKYFQQCILVFSGVPEGHDMPHLADFRGTMKCAGGFH